MKRKFIRILNLLLAVAIVFSTMCALPLNASAADSGTCGDNLTWALDDNGTLTISGTGKMEDYNFSFTVPWYDFRDRITDVKIDEGVTGISDCAFSSCSSLTSIEVQTENATYASIDGVLFSKDKTVLLFYPKGKAETNYTIPDGVTSIGDRAFNGCDLLTSVTIPNGVTSIGDWAFCNCTSLTSVTIKDGVTSIGFGAFEDCDSLTSITIPDSVTSISNQVFNYCTSLTSITIPDSVTSIGSHAFDDTAYYNDPANWTEDVLYIGNHLIESKTSISGTFSIRAGTKTIAGGAFCDCSSLTSVTIPNGVTSIGDWAFCNCTSLTSVTIPDSVTSIGGYAFKDCTSLTSFTIPDSVTSIGDEAFYGCTSLTDITIPHNVTSIEYDAFYGCKSLTSVTIKDGVTSIGDGAFGYCKSLTSVTIPNSVTSIELGAFYGCKSLTIKGYTNSYARIYAKENGIPFEILNPPVVESGTCGENITWTLDDSGILIISGTGDMDNYSSTVNSPWYDFRNKITAVKTENGVTSIGDYAFLECTSLTGITIPDSVTSIGEGTFEGCSSLTEIIIPNSVTSIGDRAFNSCSSLTSVAIFDSVTSIGKDAFMGCDDLTIEGYIDSYAQTYANENDIPFVAENGTCGENLTWMLDDDGTLTISGTGDMYGYYDPTYSVGAPWYDFKKRITAVKIDGGVTSIGEYAFFFCYSLISVTIPDSVTIIGNSAFDGCSSLTSITIPNSVTGIGWSAFEDCRSLTSIEVQTGNAAYTSIDGVLFDKGKTELICYPAGKAEINYVIPDSVTSIGDEAFWDCTSLKSVTIPDSVTSVGVHAFYGCSSLTNVTIPDSVTSIRDWAFWGCTSLTSITIPNSVTSIGRNAFADCDKLTIKGYLNSYVRTYAKENDILFKALPCDDNDHYTVESGQCGDNLTWTFNCDGTLTISGTGNMYDYLLDSYSRWYEFLDIITDVKINEGMTGIGYSAFENCTSLTNITIPDSVTSIGYSAFSGCSSLTSVTIPNSVTSIYWNAFSGCNILTIKGYINSYAQTYANENNIPFEVLRCDDNAHVYGDWVIDRAASCTETGLKHRKCELCHEIENADIVALGHDYDTEWTVDTPATETTPGSKSHHCTRCDAKSDVTEIPATGHNFGEWVETLAPTCTEAGTERRDCKDCDYYETKEINPTGHSNAAAVVENRVEPTCTVDGSYDEVIYCSVCKAEVSRENKTIDKLGHDHSAEWTVDVEPTCTTVGSKSHHCTRCDDKGDVTEIPATGHNFGEWVVTLAPTCTEAGTERRDCKDCDHYETKEINPTGHSNAAAVVENRVEPTCTVDGSYDEVIYCSVCKAEVSRENKTIDKLGHDYSAEWTVDTPAICTEKGSKSHHCTRCDAKSDVTEIAALGHDYDTEWTVDTPATETTPGSKSHHCKVCGDKTDITEIPVKVSVTEQFKDVVPDEWYVSAVQYALDNSLFFGVSDNEFAPDVAMNRAMLVTVLWRLEGKPTQRTRQSFADVPANEWYANAVAWASENGVVYGTSETEFSPEDSITREQMAAILYRYAKKKGYDITASTALDSFPDGKNTSSYARDALSWACGSGLIFGSEGKLLPQDGATRAQVAAILMRYTQKVVQ